MSYTFGTGIFLGSARVGIASSLRAQLIDSNANPVGSEISTGFVEINNGWYLFTNSYPDGFVGGVTIYSSGNANAIFTFLAINPQEIENTDEKISSAFTQNQLDITVGSEGDQSGGNATNISVTTGVL